MIMNDVKRLLKNSEDEPEAFDRLLDEYRETRNTAELLELLGDSDEELVRVSAWILSEIRASKYDTTEFRSRLIELTRHETPAIRIHSLNALFPLLQHGDPAAIRLIVRLQADENEGVRMMADAAATQLELAR